MERKELFISAEEMAEIKKRELDKLPYYINVIDSAARGKLRETAHSRILADLLRHPKIQRAFLKEMLDIDSNCDLKVETEVGSMESHIDIALYKPNEKFIIIENKANWAVEQPRQIWRYVREIAMKKYGFEESQIYVLYLNPKENPLPSEQSVKNGDDSIVETLGPRFVIKSFAYDIVNWLNKLHFSTDEPYIKSAADQYASYLEHFYGTSKQLESMKSALKEFIIERINLKAMSLNDKISELTDISEKLRDMLDTADSLNREYKEKWLRCCIHSIAEKYNLEEIPYFIKSNEFYCNCDKEWPKAGVHIKKGDVDINVLIEYRNTTKDSSNSDPDVYYGVRLQDRVIDEKNSKKIQELFNGPSDDKAWPIHKSTSFSDAEKDMSELIEEIISKETEQW